MRIRSFLIFAVSICASLALAATASARTRSLVVAKLRLDTHSGLLLPHTPAVSTPRLRKGALYVATVQGTLSYYAAIDYLDPQPPFIAFCGHPLAAPLFGSGGGVGKVSNDAQFVFAQPITTGTCAADPLPRKWLNFQANNGFGWAHPILLSAHPLTRPDATHSYDYAFVGQNRRLRFELDDPDTRDDYGSLTISVRKAVASDCAGEKWKAFQVKTRNVCLGSTAHTHGVIPPARTFPQLTTPQSPIVHVVRDTDVPTSVNSEVPAGALGAATFADYAVGARGAAKWSKTLTGAGFRSAAISEFTTAGGPAIASTAILLRSAADATRVAADEVSLATGPQKPAGDSATTSADSGGPSGTLITFRPAASAGNGGYEIVAASGSTVITLRELETPSTAVSLAQMQALAGTLVTR